MKGRQAERQEKVIQTLHRQAVRKDVSLGLRAMPNIWLAWGPGVGLVAEPGTLEM